MNTHAVPPDYPDSLTRHLVPHVDTDTWYAISELVDTRFQVHVLTGPDRWAEYTISPLAGMTHSRAVVTAVHSLTGRTVASVGHGRCWGDGATYYRATLLPELCRAGSAAP
ncbi:MULTISPECIES: hypothetical protein [Pseudonocardiaceae]|uniref:Uncharacterized protein n=1 Tax=Prauserella endophytica TaxID=1592324 RepID=A0ABY2RTT4_9PSEU|nr:MULTISPECIES: hypothetical protein [Pseudonocardiaceae]TKG60365.1 hypothetical protein FCN18_35590 [Prauserella endophytica]